MGQSSDNRPELLAPAGDFDMLKYAVAGGANAVYLGLNDFSARSKAKNFSIDELRDAVSYCHQKGVRVYLALNTLMKDHELDKAVSSARLACEAGADAVLVQDLPLLIRLKKELPELQLHASTQMGVHNAAGAKFAKKLGIDRVVLSREALSADIKSISSLGIETEVFVHGAMCVSFSGNCYFSSIVSGFSGNRGKCLQLCRKRYTLAGNTKKTGYMLSPKDISMYKSLSKLKSLGVNSLKIEGRLRSNEYAHTVSDVYSRALCGRSEPDDEVNLKTVFNRGDSSDLYINNDKADIIYDKQQNNIGVFAGKVSSVRPLKIGGYRQTDGDGFKFFRNDREVDIKKIMVGDSAHLTKSGRIAEAAQKRVSVNLVPDAPIMPLRAVQQTGEDMLVEHPYSLPEKCIIIKADEHTDNKVLNRADVIIYSPLDYNLKNVKTFKAKVSNPVLLDMPVIARGNDLDILGQIIDADIFDGYVVNNIYALELCKEKPILLGTGMNMLSSWAHPKIASIESAVYGSADVVYAFGRYPLMTLTHCPRRQLGQTCGRCDNKELFLKDDIGNSFALRQKKLHYCYFELLNSRITNLLPKINNGRLLFDATGVSGEQIIEAVTKLHSMPFDQSRHTYGRLGKGVK